MISANLCTLFSLPLSVCRAAANALRAHAPPAQPQQAPPAKRRAATAAAATRRRMEMALTTRRSGKRPSE